MQSTPLVGRIAELEPSDPSEQMTITRSAVVSRLAITLVVLWALSALLWLAHPMVIALAPVTSIYRGLSFLLSGDLDMAIVSLGISALAISVTAFSIAKRRALGVAITSIVLYWLWSLVLLSISV